MQVTQNWAFGTTWHRLCQEGPGLMARKRGNRWQADARVNGERVRRTFATREQAELFERRPTRNERSLEAIYEAVIDQKWSGSKNEADSCRNAQHALDFFGRSTDVEAIDEDAIDSYIAFLRHKGNKPSTINRKLTNLSVALKYAYRRRLIARMPFIQKFREPRGRLRWLTPDEAERLLAAFHTDEARRLATFLLETGCRIGEAKAVTWRHVQKDLVVFADTKNNQTRAVPLTRAALQAVGEPDEELDGPVFPMYESQFRREFRAACTRAGLGTEVTPHVLRHTFASWAVQRGAPLALVQKWLGHLCIAMTLRYAHLAQDDLLQVRNLMEQRPGPSGPSLRLVGSEQGDHENSGYTWR